MSESSSRALTRRDFMSVIATLAAGVAVSNSRWLNAQPAALDASGPAITIYKDPNCGCCKKWVEHIKDAGFATTVHDTKDMTSIKTSMGVPLKLQSCHTAVVGSYVIEGHVPADLVTRMLKEKPAGIGLAVPGMPAGSPGMEGMGVDKYDIMLFDRAGKTRVFASR